MKLKIGVMGHAESDLSEKGKELAFELGKAIAEQDAILITGGCPGYPFEAAKGAASQGGLVIGISPGLSLWEHVNKYHSPTELWQYYHREHYKHPSCFLNDRLSPKNHRGGPESTTD